MKNLIAKVAAAMTRMKKSIDHMFDAYTEALNELRGTPAFVQLCETYEMV